MPRIRPLCAADLPALLTLQAAAYPATLLESADFFSNRLALAPAHCWAAIDTDGRLQAYLIGYPWDDGLPPALGVSLSGLPCESRCWFLHDCAVHPQAQGSGLGTRLYQQARDGAHRAGLREGRLVSLPAAIGYWQRQGYRPVAPSAALDTQLAVYDAGAQLMACTLG